jgi:GTPase
MKWRLREGQGEAIYEIGVEDNGVLTGLAEYEMTVSLQTLQQMAYKLGATTTILRERLVDGDNGSGRKVAEVLVRKVSNFANFDKYLNIIQICLFYCLGSPLPSSFTHRHFCYV